MNALRTLVLVLVAAGCGNGDCPSSMPNGNDCSGDSVCRYGDKRCDCSEGSWYCFDNACPESQMPTGGCSPNGLYCPYGFEWTCSCESGQWSCSGGEPHPPDLGMPNHDL